MPKCYLPHPAFWMIRKSFRDNMYKNVLDFNAISFLEMLFGLVKAEQN